jgi:hypothetical protein
MADAALDVLISKEAIREALQNHGRAFDRRDRELMASVYHPGASIDFEGFIEGPAEEVIDVLMDSQPSFAAHSHQITTVTIAVDGDSAVSEAYVTATSRSHPTPSGRMFDFTFRGRYLDRWTRRDGIWAIAHRVVVTDIQSVHEVVTETQDGLPDVAADPGPDGRRARADRRDPMYGLFESLRPGRPT